MLEYCIKCGCKRDSDNFPKQGNICKACKKIYKDKWNKENKEYYKNYYKEYYPKNKEYIKNRMKKYREENWSRVYEQNINWRKDQLLKILEIFKKNPCIDCGESDPVVLDFDHVKGKKKKGISVLYHSSKWETVLKEIKKCVVRCANCHRRKTAKERKWMVLNIIKDKK